MRKATKQWLIGGASLVVIGLIVFAAVMSVYHWDFTKLSTGKCETNTYSIDQQFSDISIDTDTADILFVPSNEDVCKVVCYERKNENHSVVVKNDVLTIKQIDRRKWYEHISINFDSPKVTVYLPATEYASLFIKENTGDIEIPKDFHFMNADISLSTGDVNLHAAISEAAKIKATTGGIQVKNIAAGSLDLSVSTGDVVVSGVTSKGDIKINVTTGKTTLTDTKCKNLISSGSTGDIALHNVIAADKFSIERSTGDVKFDSADAAEISVKTDTGDVTGSLLTDKVFITETDTGNVDVPKTTTGGKCEITTDTGDIKINIISA